MKTKRNTIIATIYLILANIIILINSCTNLPSQPITRLNDPIPKEVNNFVLEFKESIYKNIGNPNFRFFEGHLKSTIGLCIIGFNYILIKKSWWDQSNFESKRALIFHELGHCGCLLSHNNDEDLICPKGIMNEYLPSTWCLKKNKDNYDRDLKKRCKRSPEIKLFDIWERLPN